MNRKDLAGFLTLVLMVSALNFNNVYAAGESSRISTRMSSVVESIIERVSEYKKQSTRNIQSETEQDEVLNQTESNEMEPLELNEEYRDDEQYLILVNKGNRLDRGYGPENTVNLADYVKSTKSQMIMEEEAAQKYIAMIHAMNDDGITDLAAVSGYRSYDYQSGLHNTQIGRYTGYLSYDAAVEKASAVVAPPGASEHQTGLALDVSSASVGYSLSESFAGTQAYKWLEENSYKYGYIIRYTREKSYITDIIYEPWHIRYVGEYHAQQIYDSGFCLEEYIESINLE